MVKIKDQDLIRCLQLFGLTKYEAEIYELLLKYRVLPAKRIAGLSKVPLTRVYDTTQSLIDRGLVGIANLKPKEYGILPLENSFNILVARKREEFEDEIRLLEKQYNILIKEVSELPKKSAPNAEDFIFTINGRKAIRRLWNSMFFNAQKEMLIFSGDSLWVENSLALFEKLIERNVDLRILANCKYSETIKKAVGLGIKIRFSNNVMRGVVMDKKALYISKKFTNSAEKDIFHRFKSTSEDEEYSCLFTEHKSMVESIREYFLMKWNSARIAGV